MSNTTPTPEVLRVLLGDFARACKYGTDDQRIACGRAIEEAFAAALAAQAVPTPPQEQPATAPQPLTEAQIEAIYDEVKGKGWSLDFARAIERAHGIGLQPSTTPTTKEPK